MPGDRLLALDVGTTSVRALVVAPDGEVLGRARDGLSIHFPKPGHVEQDPRAIWQQATEVMGAALEAAHLDATELAGVGLVSQRGTSLAWEADSGEPLAPAIGWQDRRTDARVAELNRQGVPISSLASATKLAWLIEACPAVRRAADAGRLRMGTLDAWLSERLCGGSVCVTDPGQAGATALFAADRGRWSKRTTGFFGLDTDWLPDVVPTSAVVGETPEALLGASVPVAARAGDQQASAFAQGCVTAGRAKLTLGTSAMLDLCTGAAPSDAIPGYYPLPLFALDDGTRAFCLEGTVITAASAVDWLVDLGLLAEAASLDAVMGSVSDSGGLQFVPALQGLGSPHLAADVRGLLGGLTRGTTRAQVVRAVAMGVVQRCVDVVLGLVEAVPFADGPLPVDGGLARSDAVVQGLADLLGRPVERAAETETSALGAALLAGLAVGLYADVHEAVAQRRVGARFEPMLDTTTRLSERASWQRAVERVLD